MGFYEDRILPHIIHLAMRNRRLVPYRERALASAEGRVLEIGIGSGLNLPFYSAQVHEILGLDPSPRLVAMAKRAARAAQVPASASSPGSKPALTVRVTSFRPARSWRLARGSPALCKPRTYCRSSWAMCSVRDASALPFSNAAIFRWIVRAVTVIHLPSGRIWRRLASSATAAARSGKRRGWASAGWISPYHQSRS